MLSLGSIVKSFSSNNENTLALDKISLQIEQGTTLGIIGESGSGKTTLAKILAGIIKPSSGNFSFNNFHSNTASKKDWLLYRQQLGYVFQDPYSSLNPYLTIEEILIEPFVIQKVNVDKIKIDHWLDKCKLAKASLVKKPDEFSGGQRQRIAIARALIHSPQIVIFDEAVSALDISIQSQILEMIIAFTKDITVIFIAHDLPLVHYISDKIAVINGGCLIEFNDANLLYNNPKEDYTRKLLAAKPSYQMI